MTPIDPLFPDTQSIAQLIGSACGKHTFSQMEGSILEWALLQIALDGSGPVSEVLRSYHSTLLAGAEWYSAVAAAFLQTPRIWGSDIQAAMSSFEEIRREYRNSDEAVFLFADRIITRQAGQVPPLPGFVPGSAPDDLRPKRLLELADQSDIAGETLELAKVFQDRFPHILKRPYKLSFSGSLAALFCDLEIMIDRIPRLLSVAALISLIFKPVKGH
ncbi:MAG: hypothetical protein KJ050_09630 [Candidatus Omnitrophica bacterium]|nr:hypothetical protein [bacterium]MBK7497002.1 hypothetical protein [Candidatus Omnitrophota bacterium]MCE7908592.1 hypothetical protein [Candidatus Omnitrophica bacterium COP1]MBV6482009.1 hypothetical protein [bacterium]MBW7938998.1 hypothetical protein [Candidatus Omnitrophota bacterium]